MSLEKSLKLFYPSSGILPNEYPPTDTHHLQQPTHARTPSDGDTQTAPPDHIPCMTIRRWRFALYFAAVFFSVTKLAHLARQRMTIRPFEAKL